MQISDTLKRLLILLADGRFRSGTELAVALGLSRSAIWKQLQVLSELGVELVAVSGKGYKLPKAMQLLDKGRIGCGLCRRISDGGQRQAWSNLGVALRSQSLSFHILALSG